MKNKSKYYKIISLIFVTVIILFISILYRNGYRIQPNLKIAKNGIIEMTIPLKNTTIYFDAKKYIETTEENQKIKIPASFKTHNIITERAGYFPWQKNISIYESKEYKINPVFVTSNTTGFIITANDPQYWSLRYEITNNKLPTKENPIKTENGEYLYVDSDNNIMLSNGTTTRSIIKPLTPVRSISFYKNSSENILFASDVGVYLIDTENSEQRNFYPIYKGKNPIFITKDVNSMYILDELNLMAVVI